MRGFGVTALAVGLMLTGCGSRVDGNPVAGSATSSSATSTTARTVSPAGLPNLLLGVDDVKTLLAASGMVVKHTDTQPVTFPQMQHEPPQCASAVYPGLASTLGGSGYRSYFGVEMTGTAMLLPTVNETATAFDTDSAAKRYTTRVVQQWRGCSGKKLVETNPQGKTVSWDIGVVAETNGVTAVRASVAASPEVAAVRLVGAKANVVVDLQVVGSGLGAQPRAIMDRILDRIPS